RRRPSRVALASSCYAARGLAHMPPCEGRVAPATVLIRQRVPARPHGGRGEELRGFDRHLHRGGGVMPRRRIDQTSDVRKLLAEDLYNSPAPHQENTERKGQRAFLEIGTRGFAAVYNISMRRVRLLAAAVLACCVWPAAAASGEIRVPSDASTLQEAISRA